MEESEVVRRTKTIETIEARSVNQQASSDESDIAKNSESQRKRVSKAVFGILLIDLLAFTCILPLFPALLEYYGKTDTKDGLYDLLHSCITSFQKMLNIPDLQKYNAVLYGGLLGSLFSFLQFVASPIIGAMSDVYGRKPLMVFTTIGIALSYLVWSFSTTFTLFVIARIIGGISKGNISLSTAIITDVSSPENRGKGMALVGIAFSVGFILGPMIGAFFSSYARSRNTADFFMYPAIFSLVLQLIDLAMVWYLLPETLPSHKRSKSLVHNLKQAIYYIDPRHLLNFSAVQKMTSTDRGALRKTGLAYFFYLFFFSGLEFTLTFLTHSRLEYDSVQQGRMFFFIGIIMILVQGGYVRRVAAGKEKRNAQLGILLTMPAFVVIGFAQTQVGVYVGLVLYSLGTALVVPCLTTIVSGYGRSDQKGTVMGIFRSLGALARAFGPLFGSALYWSLGPAVAYTIGGLCLTIPLFVISS